MSGVQQRPEVSVIIPAYNRFELLKEAVSTVMRQSFNNFELIVVDDGSSDMTPTISLYYKDDPRFRYFRIEHNGMPGYVRNIGVHKAAAPYIAFLDSDDLWMRDKLKKQMQFLQASPGIPIVHSRERWIRNGEEVSQKKQKHKRSGMIFDDALIKCIIGPSTVILEKELFDKAGGFREDLEVAEDYELWLKITDTTEVGYIDEPLITKRAGHGEQLSEKYGHIEIFRITALMNLVEEGFFTDEHQKAARKELSRKCRIYAAGCRKRERYNEALEYEELSRQFA
ncbi:MAG: glycosyltransferase family 2 protein [Spirochaetes bacterium]|nr:MAG: glycosyltransferase family 2 protein [Spirochaetota bacterium]